MLALASTRGHAGVKAFGEQFRHALDTRLPRFEVKGSEALYNGAVEARYEDGRWRFEGQGNLGEKPT